jgi:hypothetical protein
MRRKTEHSNHSTKIYLYETVLFFKKTKKISNKVCKLGENAKCCGLLLFVFFLESSIFRRKKKHP